MLSFISLLGFIDFFVFFIILFVSALGVVISNGLLMSVSILWFFLTSALPPSPLFHHHFLNCYYYYYFKFDLFPLFYFVQAKSLYPFFGSAPFMSLLSTFCFSRFLLFLILFTISCHYSWISFITKSNVNCCCNMLIICMLPRKDLQEIAVYIHFLAGKK